MKEINLTNHSIDRLKERLGLPKKACIKQATKAFNLGFCHSEAKGSAHRYLTKLFHAHKTANQLRVYNNFVYIFINNCLITVIPLERRLQKMFKKQ